MFVLRSRPLHVQVKSEITEIVNFLRNPRKFLSMGARSPAGILLVGPPGAAPALPSCCHLFRTCAGQGTAVCTVAAVLAILAHPPVALHRTACPHLWLLDAV